MAKRKAQAGRKLVSVPNETYDALAQLQRELAAVTGQRVTIGDVVARGAQCLCDAHAGQTWLTPRRTGSTAEGAGSNGRNVEPDRLARNGAGNRHRRNRIRPGQGCCLGERRGRR